MRHWWPVAFGLFGGLLGSGVLYLLASPPRGSPIQLIPPPSPAPLMVHVSGAVLFPGVYPLAVGSRVQDALQSAGGLQSEADLGALNLAELVQDGQKIWIPWQSSGPSRSTGEIDPGQALDPVDPEKPSSLQPINLNTAGQSELEKLPGIGPVLAQRILAYRSEHGLFTSVKQLDEVPGIGPATYAQIKDLVTVAGEQ